MTEPAAGEWLGWLGEGPGDAVRVLKASRTDPLMMLHHGEALTEAGSVSEEDSPIVQVVAPLMGVESSWQDSL